MLSTNQRHRAATDASLTRNVSDGFTCKADTVKGGRNLAAGVGDDGLAGPGISNGLRSGLKDDETGSSAVESGSLSRETSLSARRSGFPARETGLSAAETSFPAHETGLCALETGFSADETGLISHVRGLSAIELRQSAREFSPNLLAREMGPSTR
jgi:hypothetical protein